MFHLLIFFVEIGLPVKTAADSPEIMQTAPTGANKVGKAASVSFTRNFLKK
jgi:hypothetical protein